MLLGYQVMIFPFWDKFGHRGGFLFTKSNGARKNRNTIIPDKVRHARYPGE